MKRFLFLVWILVAVVSINACSSSSSVRKNEMEEKVALRDVEIRLNNIEYILPAKLEDPSGPYILKVDLSIKNNRKEMITIESNDFALFQGEKAALRALPENMSEVMDSNQLDAGKRIEGSLFYYVNKGEPVELVFAADLNQDGRQEIKGFNIASLELPNQSIQQL
nr:DUF4352 domain-containing protein [uncultured Bacillus sp.]